MDTATKIKREINPRENASILSLVFFLFTFKTIAKGTRGDLNESDIYEVLDDFRSDKLGNRLDSLWKQELAKSKPILLRCLIKMFGLQYFIIWLALVSLEITVLILSPTFTGKVVSYFEPNTDLTREDALWYAGGLLGFYLSFTLFDPTYFLILQSICIKIRIAVCTLLYRKCLKLNLSTSPQFASGTIVTLITKDLMILDTVSESVQLMMGGVFHISIATFIMYRAIGVSALVGVSFLILLVPLQVYLGKTAASYRLKTLGNTDQRVRITQEILTAIRIIKMYTWELFFSKLVGKIRKKEVKNLRFLFYIKSFALSLGQLSSRAAFYLCVMSYVTLGNHITAEKAFIVITCFACLTRVITFQFPTAVATIAELEKSFKRITRFLLLDEIIPEQNVTLIKTQNFGIAVENVSVTTENITLLKNINTKIEPGLTIVTGPVGGGKSTFLKLLLGEISKDGGDIKVTGKVSYSSQEPWLFPGTVKQNLIFGEEFDKERYEQIIKVCALERDFAVFPKGDQTVVVDKGLNFSRGQKTRINLARAIYREADIYLLDDCLSAVDAQVGKHIFYECIKKFLKNKVCLIVTHQEQLFQESDNIIVINKGCIEFQGTYDNLDKSKIYQITTKIYGNPKEFKSDGKKREENTNEVETEQFANQNIYTEKLEEGGVKKEVYYKLFVRSGGIKMISVVLFLSIAAQVAGSWSDYFVSFWVDTEQDLSGFRFNRSTESAAYKKLEETHDNLMIQYSFVILAATILTLLNTLSIFLYFTKISKNVHNTVLNNILKAEMLFFDKNLSGNILNRFSRDLGIIDEQIPKTMFDVIKVTFTLLGIFFVVSSVNLYFIIPSVVFTVVLYFARRFYLPTGRSIRRLEGATRSPIIGHLNATLEGLTTIRASHAQSILREEFDSHQNLFNSVSYMNLAVTKAFGLYICTLSTFYIAIITLSFLLIKTESLAGEVGLAITQSFQLSEVLQWGIRHWTELENQMTSSERIFEYTKIKGEKTDGEKFEKWPTDGRIVYKNVNLQYLPTSGKVLKDVKFEIEAKNRIGIVGRTGAGKSSILSILFKLYEFEGSVTIDDVDIRSLDVKLLRSKISIIPQDPVLFSGTIRSNLDPNDEYEDQEIWNALEEVQMSSSVDSLHYVIPEGGSNFSIGQRQLICLARAIVRKNLILVLDEATANMDPQTDALIQSTITKVFTNCTKITVAHRLNTIMDSDKVLVMDSGMVIEYDSPEALLKNKSSLFSKMIQEAGLTY